MQVDQAIVLTILLSKGEVPYISPDYVRENVEAVEKGEFPERILDAEGRAVFNQWLERWGTRG